MQILTSVPRVLIYVITTATIPMAPTHATAEQDTSSMKMATLVMVRCCIRFTLLVCGHSHCMSINFGWPVQVFSQHVQGKIQEFKKRRGGGGGGGGVQWKFIKGGTGVQPLCRGNLYQNLGGGGGVLGPPGPPDLPLM